MSTEVEQKTPTDESKKTELEIIRQVEFYFGNYNLPRDKFMKEQMRFNRGWIPMATMVKFKRLAEISTDVKVIMDALKNSKLMEVDEIDQKIRRSPLIPIKNRKGDSKADINRTVYCKGFPQDPSVTTDKLLKQLGQYGPFELIKMRRYYDKMVKQFGFKGSILIVFSTVEEAKNYMKIEEVKYEEKPLIRRWYGDYLEEKKEEMLEKQRLEQIQKENEEKGSTSVSLDIFLVPQGSLLFASGFSTKTTREDIKLSLMKYTNDVAFIDFSKGQTEGYIRLSTPFSNKQLLEKIDGKLKVNDNDITVRLVDGEEEAELIKKIEEARIKDKNQPKKTKSGQKLNKNQNGNHK